MFFLILENYGYTHKYRAYHAHYDHHRIGNAEIEQVAQYNDQKNKISKHAIAASELDNKNRIQFFNGIYNSSGWVQNDEGGVPAQNYGYKNYVYRAYSYMKLKNGTVIKSVVPAYFTMYDVATADAIDM